MEKVNALEVRNKLGEILDRLQATGEPILVNKGRKLRAVLVTPEDFKERFLDYRIEEEKRDLLNELKSLKKRKKHPTGSLDLIRALRGYDQ